MAVRIIVAGNRGIRGLFPSRKVGRQVAYESKLERDFLLLQEADPCVRTYEEQPFRISFASLTGTRARRYTPDVRVVYTSGTTEIIEVKYEHDLAKMDVAQRADLALAHAAARLYCAERGWSFAIRTEAHIRTPLLERATRLRMHSREPAALPELRASILGHVRAAPGIPMADLVAKLDAPDARSCVLHLIWVGALHDGMAGPPTLSTRLRLHEASP